MPPVSSGITLPVHIRLCVDNGYLTSPLMCRSFLQVCTLSGKARLRSGRTASTAFWPTEAAPTGSEPPVLVGVCGSGGADEGGGNGIDTILTKTPSLGKDLASSPLSLVALSSASPIFLPLFGVEIVKTVVYLRNRTPMHVLNNKAPRDV